ncbi:ABC1 kinase family protein [Aliibacillus thermotolerans]|mgnify:CR=1 FL=1|uniref:ABC1 kinase family protein n=1 Tax=Aliibacillus thermotolerans TaxID=1834418 RepID=A0ABW0U7H3_9BACI|nr:AarF/UbiB family protein [Aliibacillus thermotolerans]MDA3130152.1 ABC transporter [Aliibacillus thermotolerans]
MALKQGLKHANRYRKIVTTLARHGFGYVLEEVGLFHILSLPKRIATATEEFQVHSIGKRIRRVLEELGPTYIKLGQLVSTRKDLFPPQIIEELEKLQDEVEPFSFDIVKETIESDLDDTIDELFLHFDKEPLAAASIGQVHVATLPDHTKVAVKVLRPNIREDVERDIDILRDLAKLLTQRFSWAKYYQLQDIVEEYVEAIRDEIDYYIEARNTEKMRNNMTEVPNVFIPETIDGYCSRRVLTMSFVEGLKIAEVEEQYTSEEKKRLARTLIDAFLHQVLMDGYFHSDPHPGNLLFVNKGKVAFIDFGQVGRLNKRMRKQFIDFVIALIRYDAYQVAQVIREMAHVPDTIDNEQFAEDVEYLLSKYYDRSFQDVRFGEAVNDIFFTAHRYDIQIYKEYAMLAKAIITLESVVEHLDPHISILEIAEPYGRILAKERWHPKSKIKEWIEEGNKQKEYLLDLPRELRDVLAKINKERIGIELNMPKVSIFLNKLDRISNRLSFSVILLAFSIIMVGLIIGSTFGDSTSLLVRLPVIEISFIVSFLMFLWLLYAIFKSGRF